MPDDAPLKRGPRGANARLRGLLVMLPWLMEREETPVAEAAARFQLTEREVVADLERVAMCGLPPYGPGDLIDLYIEDGVIHIGQRQFLTRPLRLSAPEGFALLVAGRAAMQLPGGELAASLGSALDKLAAALGDGSIEVDLAAPPFTAEITAAAESGNAVTITYRSSSSEELTERLIHPQHVFADRGHWYVGAYDTTRNDRRTFRIDRIERVEAAGLRFLRSSDPASVPDWFTDAGDLQRVTLRLEPSARWVAERYPVESIVPDSASVVGGEMEEPVTVTMAVTSERWLERVLLRAGHGATVVAPERWRMLGRSAAETVLQRYRSTN